MKTGVLIFSLIIVATIAAFAQDATPKADVRQGAQRARIHEGRK